MLSLADRCKSPRLSLTACDSLLRASACKGIATATHRLIFVATCANETCARLARHTTQAGDPCVIRDMNAQAHQKQAKKV